eukprot:GFYU01001811.1.p1 GENE.GFYU01001811.1~~GFYU01001811.1.p1  ORF type:complete len:336 (+),score=89.75 GFYU01001811.1:163-1170(+)
MKPEGKEFLAGEQPWYSNISKETKGVVGGILVILTIGISLGLGMHPSNKDPEPWNKVSSVIGWTYFAAWSISFYPQVFQNFYRKSVIGLSFDYLLYNIIGFSCYSIFNVAFYWSDKVQSEYRAHNNGKDNVVQVNDVFFALHAVVLTLITIAQCFMYPRGEQKLSWTAIGISIVGVLMAIVYGILVATANADSWEYFTTLYWLYFLSYLKLAVSLIKYLPQVYLNWSRKSTVGWNIWNVLLDFTGGALSVVQLLMDSGLTNNWEGVSGDPVKFGLGFVSMVFDIVFMIQHYGLYTNRYDPDHIKNVEVHDDGKADQYQALSSRPDVSSVSYGYSV